MMPNMELNKTKMVVQEPNIRNSNFDEVALGYTYEEALNEAKRCLNCKNKSCVSACPVAIDIPAFIQKIVEEDIEGAYKIISDSSSLPAVCGRVCPQENQCEGKCARGIKGEPVAIGRLERFVADYHRENAKKEAKDIKKNGHKVIIITSMKHTLAEEPRHPSGKKLYEFGDIVIDNCGPHGDALIQTDGVEKVSSVSSICNNCVAQSMAARTVELLKEDRFELPVLNGDKAHDDALKKKYEGRAGL